MLETIKKLIWWQISNVLQLPLESVKVIVPNAYQRIRNLKMDDLENIEFSDNLLKAVTIYSDFIEILER